MTALLRVHEIAAKLSVSKGAVYKLIKTPAGPPCKRISARGIRFDRGEFEAWLANLGKESGKDASQAA